MFDFQNDVSALHVKPRSAVCQSSRSKRVFDYSFAVILLLPVLVFGLILILLTPFMNAGPLLFWQVRMGQDCKPFTVIKFRTMRPVCGPRGAFDHVETERITVLGRFLRQTRIDELPQVINVLRGEMSLIGPRPDSYEHAQVYLRDVPGYAARQHVLPGISGYAQTEIGYVDAIAGLHRKVAADLYYIANASFGLDMWIVWRTLIVIAARKGV